MRAFGKSDNVIIFERMPQGQACAPRHAELAEPFRRGSPNLCRFGAVGRVSKQERSCRSAYSGRLQAIVFASDRSWRILRLDTLIRNGLAGQAKPSTIAAFAILLQRDS